MNSHERTLNELKRILEKTMPHHGVTVYLFGSWARMQQKQSSDIDIAIDAEHPNITLSSGRNGDSPLEQLGTVPLIEIRRLDCGRFFLLDKALCPHHRSNRRHFLSCRQNWQSR